MATSDKLRKQLDQIDTWLCEEGGEKLWDVLSALRGPDVDDTVDLKETTTIVIRAAAFPQCAEMISKGHDYESEVADRAFFITPYKTPTMTVRQKGLSQHFYNHIRFAWAALTGQNFVDVQIIKSTIDDIGEGEDE